MEDTIKEIIRHMIKNPAISSLIQGELIKQSSDDYYNQESEEIFFHLNQQLKLSHLRITEDCRLYLTDYGNVEIVIPGYQAKAFYIFHLLTPCSISNIELVEKMEVKEVLTKIYMQVCKHKSNDKYRAEHVITGLLNRTGGISDATNKINVALKKLIVKDEILKLYIINGERGGTRKVLLPKQLIRVENKELQVLTRV